MKYDPAQPHSLDDILADQNKQAALVDLAKKRYMSSAEYCRPWHERWVRFYKIYRSIVDAV